MLHPGLIIRMPAAVVSEIAPVPLVARSEFTLVRLIPVAVRLRFAPAVLVIAAFTNIWLSAKRFRVADAPDVEVIAVATVMSPG